MNFSFLYNNYFATLLNLTIIILSLQCGNPAVRRYLILAEKLPLKKSDALNHQKKKSKKKFSSTFVRSIEIYNKGGFKIFLESIDPDDIDDLAEALGLYESQRYYRLPGLTYFKFKVENMKKHSTFKLFNSYFSDDTNNEYHTVPEKEYQKRYTSPSYNRFDFNFIHSFYVTERNSKKPDDDDFYFAKYLPDDDIDLGVSFKGFQIIAYDLFSVGKRHYTLHLNLNDEEKPIEIKFLYRTTREDIEAQ